MWPAKCRLEGTIVVVAMNPFPPDVTARAQRCTTGVPPVYLLLARISFPRRCHGRDARATTTVR